MGLIIFAVILLFIIDLFIESVRGDRYSPNLKWRIKIKTYKDRTVYIPQSKYRYELFYHTWTECYWDLDYDKTFEDGKEALKFVMEHLCAGPDDHKTTYIDGKDIEKLFKRGTNRDSSSVA